MATLAIAGTAHKLRDFRMQDHTRFLDYTSETLASFLQDVEALTALFVASQAGEETWLSDPRFLQILDRSVFLLFLAARRTDAQDANDPTGVAAFLAAIAEGDNGVSWAVNLETMHAALTPAAVAKELSQTGTRAFLRKALGTTNPLPPPGGRTV